MKIKTAKRSKVNHESQVFGRWYDASVGARD